MKYKLFRSFMRRKQLNVDYCLQDCIIVVDAKSYFNALAYGKSGCQYIFGAECDRYAAYLKNNLKSFLDNNVTCYFVFNGAMNAGIEKRTEIHERIIQRREHINCNNIYEETYDPIFVKDVQKEVLRELGIKYFCCEYDSREAIISLGKHFECPVITSNIENCMYGISCIPPTSINNEKDSTKLTCSIYDYVLHKTHVGIRDYLIPVFLTLVDEDEDYFDMLPTLIPCRKHNIIPSVLRWVRRQEEVDAMSTILKNLENEHKRKMFLDSCEGIERLVQLSKFGRKRRHTHHINDLKYIQKHGRFDLFLHDDMWFAKGVFDGRIEVCYVNLRNIGLFSGSWHIYAKDKDDAMLAAVDIISFIHCLLTGSQKSTLTFIGRKLDTCCVWDIKNTWKKQIPHAFNFGVDMKRKINTGKHRKQYVDVNNPFYFFLRGCLPGFNINMLQDVPEDSKLLIISLVYYIRKRNTDFVTAAYSILLSYVMLGHVSKKVGVLKRTKFFAQLNNFDGNDCDLGLAREDCLAAANALIDLFYVKGENKKFDRNVLHQFAEFQHCLQHMNNLNKFCRETIQCTAYSKTYNGTFVNNVYDLVKDKKNPVEYLGNILEHSSVFSLFKNVCDVFDKCRLSVRAE